jgi:Flp pilus assembly pilin Flp
MQALDTALHTLRSHISRCQSEDGQGLGEYALMAVAVVVALNLMDTLGQEILWFFDGIAAVI